MDKKAKWVGVGGLVLVALVLLGGGYMIGSYAANRSTPETAGAQMIGKSIDHVGMSDHPGTMPQMMENMMHSDMGSSEHAHMMDGMAHCQSMMGHMAGAKEPGK